MTKPKILIVDDDREMQILLNARLRASGYATAFACDGLSAISMARKEQPDLILLDLGLPAGDGFEVLERLKTNLDLAHVPVVVLSARDPDGRERNRGRVVKAGAHTYIQKPFDDDELLDAITYALD